MNFTAPASDVLVYTKKTKIIELYYDFIHAKINHYSTESNYKLKTELENSILELLTMFEKI